MQMLKSDYKSLKFLQKQLLPVIAFVVLVGIGGRLTIDSGVITPFSLQTLFLALIFYFSSKAQRIVAVLTYLLLGILGLPLFLDGASGLDYFKSSSLGFFIGFVLAAFVSTRGQSYIDIFTYFIVVHFVIVLCGLLGLAALQSAQGLSEITIALIPGMVVKSLLGAVLVYVLLRFNSRNTG